MTQIDQPALNARNRLIAMFLLLCVLDIALVIIARDRWAIGRILFTVVIMYFAIQGRKWAKWLLIGMCSLLVVALVAMMFALRLKLSATLMAGSLIMTVLSTIIPIYMITSKNLNRYFCAKRQAFSQ